MKNFLRTIALSACLFSTIGICGDEKLDWEKRKVAGAGNIYIPTQAIDVSDVKFFNSKDEEVTFEKLGDKFIIMHAWDSTCVFCILEMSKFMKFANIYKNKGIEIVFVTLNIKKSLENEKKVFAKYNKYGFEFYYFARTKDYTEFKARELPTTFVYDKNHREILRMGTDAKWASKNMVEFFDQIFAKLATN